MLLCTAYPVLSLVSLAPCTNRLVPHILLPAATHDKLASNGAGPNALSYVHVLRRCQGEHCTELVRMRTTWRVGEA